MLKNDACQNILLSAVGMFFIETYVETSFSCHEGSNFKMRIPNCFLHLLSIKVVIFHGIHSYTQCTGFITSIFKGGFTRSGSKKTGK